MRSFSTTPPAARAPLAVVCGVLLGLGNALAETASTMSPRSDAAFPDNEPAPEAPSDGPEDSLYVREYRVTGVQHLTLPEVEKAVYPFLGPSRTTKDVEGARAALEKAFQDKGYKTVVVEVPPQVPRRGVIKMLVTENTVGRLRVRNSRYFTLDQIKQRVPSLAEGKVVDFNEVTKEIIALNSAPDLQVKPSVNPGVEPGTVDIDLEVKDKSPLHGSLELNNRYTADTAPLRVNAALNYSNLWQKGHAAGISYQVAPESPKDASVYAAYYLAKFDSLDNVSLMLNATKQDSNVSTLGGAAVTGRGEIFGVRALINLPTEAEFYQTASLGVDYKHFKENVLVGTSEIATPITYFPISASYGANWSGKHSFTEFNSTATFSLRGLGGSDELEYDNKRYQASAAFFHIRADASHTQDLPLGAQVFGKISTQGTANSLINSEQFSAGGMGTVRGYLESTQLGDNGLAVTLELRTPSLLGRMNPQPEKESEATRDPANEWRIYGFWDGARLSIVDPLPDQKDTFKLMSVGVGTRVKLKNHFHGSLDAGWPLINQTNAKVGEVLLSFKVSTDF